MGFFDLVGGAKKTALSEQVTHVQLTERGETKLKNIEPTGRKFDVCAAVKKLQPCSAKEIADEVHWPENKVRFMLGELAHDGWIERAG